jgi:hypothetical protein
MVARFRYRLRTLGGEEAMPRIAATLAVFLTVVTCIGFNTARYPVVWEMAAAPGDSSHADKSEQSASAAQQGVVSESTTPSQSASFSESPAPDPSSESLHTSSSWGADEASAGAGAWDSAGAEPTYTEADDTDRGWSSEWTADDPDVAEASSSFDHVAMRRTSGDGYGYGEPGDEDPTTATSAGEYGTSAIHRAASTTEGAEHAEVEPWASDDWESQEALVPVEPAPTTQYAAGPAEAASGWDRTSGSLGAASLVRRLPPVDRVWRDPDAVPRPPIPEDSIPIYPTTDGWK